jgi:hypothetical protein
MMLDRVSQNFSDMIHLLAFGFVDIGWYLMAQTGEKSTIGVVRYNLREILNSKNSELYCGVSNFLDASLIAEFFHAS